MLVATFEHFPSAGDGALENVFCWVLKLVSRNMNKQGIKKNAQTDFLSDYVCFHASKMSCSSV